MFLISLLNICSLFAGFRDSIVSLSTVKRFKITPNRLKRNAKNKHYCLLNVN